MSMRSWMEVAAAVGSKAQPVIWPALEKVTLPVGRRLPGTSRTRAALLPRDLRAAVVESMA